MVATRPIKAYVIPNGPGIVGPQGPEGPQGNEGPTGPAGGQIYVQTTEPVGADPGDMWLDTDEDPTSTVDILAMQDDIDLVKSRVFDVREYGAAGDGSTNDRAAIQAAIDAAEAAGGGTVWFPKGTYKVQITTATVDTSPSSDGQHCLRIDGNDITLDGAPGAILDCFPLNGDPDTNWEVVGGSVWRGGGIFISGGADYANRRHHVTIRNLEIDGNFTYTGDHGWPADTGDGTGWDTTHKGIWYQNDTYLDEMVVDNVHIHNFSGEVIYSGGGDDGAEPGLGRFRVSNCSVHDTNGSAVSMSGRWFEAYGNDIHTAAGSGIENAYKGGRQDIHHNRIYACDLDALTIVGYGEDAGSADVHDNHIGPSADYGIGLMSAWNAHVHHNTIIDCAAGGIRQEIGSGYPNDTSRDVDISENTIMADHANMSVGIAAGFNAGAVFRVRVFRNRIGLTQYASDNGFIIAEPYSGYPSTDYGQIVFTENTYDGTHGHSVSARAIRVAATVGSQVTVAQLKPPISAIVEIAVTLQVITGATDVYLRISYQDWDGNLVSDVVENFATKAVGIYVYPVKVCGVGPRFLAFVNAQATNADRAYVTATIREI